MKRIFALAVLLVSVASFVLVRAQQTAGVASNPLGGPISASSTNCSVAQSCVWMRLPFNASVAAVNVTGTFSETLLVEQSGDGGNTFSTAATLTAAGLTTYSVSGMTDFRVRCSSFVSGTAFVNLNVGASGGGTSNISQWGGASVTAAVSGASDAISSAGAGPIIVPFLTEFNGVSWDRYFYCPNTATFSVVSTVTQVVALSGTTKIRVCSTTFFPSTATAGSVDLVYGTGASCGTGTTTLTGAATLPAAAVVSIPLSIPSTGPLITPAGQALCVRTVTSTVAGFLTWVQY